MNIMTALTVAFIFGLGISNTSAEQLRKVSDQGRDIIELFLNKVMIPALPFYIAGVFADMTVKGTVFATLQTFSLVLLAVIAMHWFWLSFQFITTGVALKKIASENPSYHDASLFYCCRHHVFCSNSACYFAANQAQWCIELYRQFRCTTMCQHPHVRIGDQYRQCSCRCNHHDRCGSGT